MPPLQPNLDPDGHYALLAVAPDATQEAIVAAYRLQARRLHPDVPGTGNAAAFMAVKRAYDVLSDPQRRTIYDREARSAAMAAIEPEVFPQRPVRHVMSQSMAIPPIRRPRLSDLPLPVWIGVGLVLTFGVVQIVLHLSTQPAEQRTTIRPIAQPVAALSETAHQEVLYGPRPQHLPGIANFYVSPETGQTTLYHMLPDRTTLEPIGHLPPFSSVQGVRLLRQHGLIEVVTGNGATGFIQAQHLTPGDLLAAHEAYCGYNAGTLPQDGEVLDRSGRGDGTLTVHNRSVQPVVMRLRDAGGTSVVSVFLGPGSDTEVTALPRGEYRPEYAIGELWSRACNSFAAGMRAWRLRTTVRIPGAKPLTVTDQGPPDGADGLSEQVFGQR